MGLARRLSTPAGLLFAAGLLYSQAAAFPKLPAVDRYGDPLPTGAVARLGTVHLRAGSFSIQFSLDGRTLVGVDGRILRAWDAADGRPVITRRLPGPESLGASWSADRRTLVLSVGPTVELWDVVSGERVETRLPTGLGQSGPCAVSNDRRWVLVTDTVARSVVKFGQSGTRLSDAYLLLWDTATRKSRFLAKDGDTVTGVALSEDGRRAAAVGGQATRVWDTASGKLLWEARNTKGERIQFTPGGRHLIAAPTPGRTPGTSATPTPESRPGPCAPRPSDTRSRSPSPRTGTCCSSRRRPITSSGT